MKQQFSGKGRGMVESVGWAIAHGRLFAAVAAVVAVHAARADWESWQKPMVYGATFDAYESGQQLSDVGTVNGTWGDVSAGGRATTSAEKRTDTQAMCMTYETALDSGIVFTPEIPSDRGLQTVIMSTQLLGLKTLPTLNDNARAALAIYVPESGPRTFVGWAWSETENKCRWFELEAEGASPDVDGWRDVSIRFFKDATGVVRMQYRLNVGTAAEKNFVPLHIKETSTVWLDAGARTSDQIVSKVEFRGVGSLEVLDGTEPQRGLAAGVGERYDVLFNENVFDHGYGEWTKRPTVKGSDYSVKVDSSEDPDTYIPSVAQKGSYLVSRFSVVFENPSTDETVPDGSSAGIRLVETEDGARMFACLVDGAWTTNRTVRADLSAKYTVEVGLDRVARTVTYKIRRGYGAEGGTNVVLCVGKVSDESKGTFEAIDFSGAGYLREIKGVDKSQTAR